MYAEIIVSPITVPQASTLDVPIVNFLIRQKNGVNVHVCESISSTKVQHTIPYHLAEFIYTVLCSRIVSSCTVSKKRRETHFQSFIFLSIIISVSKELGCMDNITNFSPFSSYNFHMCSTFNLPFFP